MEKKYVGFATSLQVIEMDLDDILTEQKLTNSPHDKLIMAVNNYMSAYYQLDTIMMNAYYKLPHQITDKGLWLMEGDADLLMAGYDVPTYREVDSYTEIPVEDVDIYLFEMKTTDNNTVRSKAIKQLIKTKTMIEQYTPYEFVIPYYCYWQDKNRSKFIIERQEL